MRLEFPALSRRRAFTLVELLVVISILGVLSALVMSSLKGVRNRASQARDVTTIRSMASGLLIYASENGAFPGNSSSTAPTWDLVIAPYLSLPPATNVGGAGLRVENAKDYAVYASKYDTVARKDGYAKRSYAIAGWIQNPIKPAPGQPSAYELWGATWPVGQGAPLNAIRYPSRYVLLSLVGISFFNKDNVVGGQAYSQSDWPGTDPKSWPYNGGALFTFCDGHAEIMYLRDFKDLNDYRLKHGDNR